MPAPADHPSTTGSGIDLSVLICSTHTRWKTFGQAIQQQIWEQYEKLAPGFQSSVEILILTDNKAMMLGAKRNAMVDIAQGRYVAFVDDDDRIEPDYLVSLLDAARFDADVITFQVSVSINGDDPLICRYSKDFAADRNLPDGYERLPNHLMAVKRELAEKVPFPSVLYGEDSGYSKALRPLLVSEHAIDRVLYHYDYCDLTTETQEYKLNRLRPRQMQTPIVDLIILSKAATPELRAMTQRTVHSAMTTAHAPINIIVLEQMPGVTYRHTITFRMHGEFNYNAFANHGAGLGSADWIMIANNDLIFHDGWLHNLLAAEHPVVSPKNPGDRRQEAIVTNTAGTVTGQHFSGWCFMLRREVWEKIGGFDEDFRFWCADDATIEQLKAVGVTPMLVPSAEVKHLVAATHSAGNVGDDLTWGQVELFNRKYGAHRLSRDSRFLRWKKQHA